MSKHTPGPWTIVGADRFATGIWGPKAEDVVPATSAPMLQANARLIAAAPDLLEALKVLHAAGNTVSPLSGDYGNASVKAVRIAGKFMAAMEKAEAAIAKAEGKQ